MESCPKCGCILKTKEGTFSSVIGSTDVYFTQLKYCDNKQCENFNEVIETIDQKMN